MQYSFRWYGPKDPVKLTDIRQSNADYIVTSLHQIPTGEKWNYTDVEDRINLINKSNNDYANKLKWNVVESIPVHNDIKLRKNNFKKYSSCSNCSFYNNYFLPGFKNCNQLFFFSL